ncbi:MAG: DUF1917 domain-containing protein [Anaerolineae bacterium]|nr:DUF1917 domain-containing protein [Anaerolineae bacterium]
MNDSSQKPAPPNLDLIQLVQAARLAYDADVLPSQVNGVYWLEVKRETPGPGPTSRAGAWVIETTAGEVDALWVLVRAATRDGRLGYKAKAATAARAGGGQREIHVAAYDTEDSADVERVRMALVALGVTGPLRYDRS